MLRLFRRTRSLCLVALLAILMATGGHGHAGAFGDCPGDAPAAATLVDSLAQGTAPDDGQPGGPVARHCALCHAPMAVPPQAGAAGEPILQAGARLRPGIQALAEGQGPDGLTRPPRGSHRA